jgi:3-hydroxyacyl-CoA dehydrogenase
MGTEMATPDQSATPGNAETVDLEELKRSGKVFKENAGASILDIGDGVGLVEFHTKANSLNDDVCEMLMLATNSGASRRFDAVVIGNRGRHFSAGANLQFLLEAARASRWKDIERTIRTLQDATMSLKYGSIPVVAAPFSNALGGGCEVCLHSARVVAANSVRMGLVEAGVGLIPAGGGTKELGLRAQADSAAAPGTDALPALRRAFELIVTAKTSHTGAEAKQLFLAATDIVVPTQEGAIAAAKQVAIALVKSGYRNGAARADVPVIGTKGLQVFRSTIDQMRDGKTISDHDAVIALHVATILCGGDQSAGTANEQHFLDLEREAFLSLVGTEKTQARIEHLLVNNRPLRN